MLGRKNYTQDEVDHAEQSVAQQIAAYTALTAAISGEVTGKEVFAASEDFEPLFFNNMVLVLDRYFVHRIRAVTGKDGNPLNEVEIIADSLIRESFGAIPVLQVRDSRSGLSDGVASVWVMAGRVVKRAFKYRFYPTAVQAEQLARTFGCTRYVYNRALAERSRAWSQERRRVSYADTSKMLTGWKRDTETAWLSEPSKGPLQELLRQLQGAFDRFWRKQSRYPQFKRKDHSKDSATYYSSCFTYRGGQLRLAKQSEPLDIRWSRPLPEGAVPSQVTVSRNARGRYHISILVEDTITEPPPTDRVVGLDAGITSLYTLSTGEKITNPRHERKDRERLAKAQRVLARKEKGSRNRAKARLKVAKIHGRIADRRRDYLHTLSTRLVRENQVIAVEDLSVRNMVRNRSLSRAISDASWSEFRSMLEYKADWYGRRVVAIDRFYPSSKMCSVCGSIASTMPLDVREWACRCGVVHDRDVNAAKNIVAVGLTVAACGDGVRPPRT